MIELVSADRCIACDKCVKVCPTDVFDRGHDGIPTISRQSDCQTCYQCEANCPVDALFVAPQTHPLPSGAPSVEQLGGLMGSYRERIGWGHGRTPGATGTVHSGVRGHPPAVPGVRDPPGERRALTVGAG